MCLHSQKKKLINKLINEVKVDRESNSLQDRKKKEEAKSPPLKQEGRGTQNSHSYREDLPLNMHLISVTTLKKSLA